MRENFGKGWDNKGPRKGVPGWDEGSKSKNPKAGPVTVTKIDKEAAA
ncbi:hypothetical protein KIP54_gp47 [Mycobacterium phage JewelBug]|uniref:Uncharacterized protein n=1 Tax=Mycobacterium phage JewelBug TaxID=2502450 RepID=A0A411CGI4_9CAUD|nr:hypothetical protein KIP54_gp47 [Mycobacterium phage JewelBug]QAY12946.1 hypothetical protein SEA_JEWELBUG_56 [Mycobacterium phage JewelBug]